MTTNRVSTYQHVTCPKCAGHFMIPVTQEVGDLSCIYCGFMVYTNTHYDKPEGRIIMRKVRSDGFK